MWRKECKLAQPMEVPQTNSNIGLLTYDEVVYAGGYYSKANMDYYLYNSAISWWTMSPGGFMVSEKYGDSARVWVVFTGGIGSIAPVDNYTLRPVINLNSDVTATGLGTSEKPYAIQ